MFFHIHKIFLAFFFGILYNGYMEKTIRQPQQERSNEKKQKIIDASYELFAEIGYYSANTQEIAKRAGVSTGIVYSYFKDKRDILLHVLKIYIDKVTEPFGRIIDGIKLPLDIDALIVESSSQHASLSRSERRGREKRIYGVAGRNHRKNLRKTRRTRF